MYILVAVAFSVTFAAPTVTQVGVFADALSCQNAAFEMSRTIEDGIGQSVPTHQPYNTSMLLQCLPQKVPAVCESNFASCGNTAPINVYQP